ncbi:hypothetical protein PUN28_002436 [Cardiocondyla obscurior]
MKVLLIAVALLLVVEGKAYPQATYPIFQNERGPYPGRGSYWAPPQRIENQNNGLGGSDVEWVCQNPRTNDIMIIASDDTRHTPQHHPGRVPWHNVPPGHQHGHHPHGNRWTQPIVIVQETYPNGDKSQTPPPPLPKPTENPNNIERQTEPPYNKGEGVIDIRMGNNN